MATTFPPLKETVPGYVYGGFAVLAGRQRPSQQAEEAAALRLQLNLALRWPSHLDLFDQLPHSLGKAPAGAIEPEHRGRAIAAG